MKQRHILVLSFLFLCGITLWSHPLQAQDQVVLTPRPQDVCCWDFTVKNRSAQAINKIEFTITTLGQVDFTEGAVPANWETPSLSNNNRVVTYTGLPIQSNQDLSGFSLCFGTTVTDQPVKITWKTYNNATVLTSRDIELICTPFQGMQRIDSVGFTTSTSGTDACYSFSVFNKHQPAVSQINAVSFQLLTTTAGTIRPKLVTAPEGWQLDSVTPYQAYFSTTTNPIVQGQGQSGFGVCLRSNAATKLTNWVWRVRDDAWGLVSRDTLRNLANNAQNGAPSCDEVNFTNVNGCLYNFSVANYHAMNLQPPSRITSVRLIRRSSGITFTGATTKPTGWGASVKADTIFYAASSESVGIPSGVVNTSFAVNLSNPSGGAFDLEWQTLSGTTVLCSTVVNLRCVVEAPRVDSAVITPVDGRECCYRIDIRNLHNNPPSNLMAVALSVPQGSGTISGEASSLNWSATAGQGNRSVLYQAQAVGDAQTTGVTQSINFCVSPSEPGQPVPITWQTFEQAGGTAITSGTQPVTCSPVILTCDTVWSTTVDQAQCRQQIWVSNRRTTDDRVTSIVVRPLNGWTIDTALAPAPWTSQTDLSRTTLTFNGSLDAGISQPFTVAFKGVGTPDTFSVEVVTNATDNSVCVDTLGFRCEPTSSVKPSIEHLVKLTIAPNPTVGQSTIQFTMPEPTRTVITLLDVLGKTSQLVFDGMAGTTNTVALDASTLPNGTYYLRLETAAGIVTKRIVVQR